MKEKIENKQDCIDIKVIKGTTIVKSGDLTATINVGKHWWFFKRDSKPVELRLFCLRKETK